MDNYLRPDALDAGRVEDLVKQYFTDADEVSNTLALLFSGRLAAVCFTFPTPLLWHRTVCFQVRK